MRESYASHISRIQRRQPGVRVMRIAVASGKGGTGKTTVATHMAVLLARGGEQVTYADCDVEAPNGHLFLKPNALGETVVSRFVPRVNHAECLHCGECSGICRFNAIVSLPAKTLVYEDLCHSCGGCSLVCPSKAISEVPHPIGVIKEGAAGAVRFISGTLSVGEASCPPLIRAVKEKLPETGWTILDAPPGTACAFMETVRDCDYVILVTEPTPFGLHDLALALEVAKTMQLSCGVVVNRARPMMAETRDLCRSAGVPILAEIADDIEVARAYARGQLAVDAVPAIGRAFQQLLTHLARLQEPAAATAAVPGGATKETIA